MKDIFKTKNHVLFKFCLFYLLCMMTKSYGQTEGDKYMPLIIPPSQDAYKFSTYGNIPQNNPLGAFNYSVPIYQIEEGDIILPVSMDYSSNGVKVDALQSLTGVDWNLNAGGIISRVMRDKPDDISKIWYLDNLNLHNDSIKKRIVKCVDAERNIDTQQDWFYFNFNGISGSFFFDQNFKAHINCEENIEIEYITKSEPPFDIMEFVLKDSKGFKYFFGGENQIEITAITTIGGLKEPTIGFNSAWSLKKIISPNNNEINFEYKTINTHDILGISETLSLYEIYNPREPIQRYKAEKNVFKQEGGYSKKALTKIILRNGILEFNYIDNLLGEIVVSNKNAILKRIQLKYDQIESRSSFSELPVDISPEENKSLFFRSFLKEIIFLDSNNNGINRYNFDYYDCKGIPPRLSYSKDRYGYSGFTNFTAFSKDAWKSIKNLKSTVSEDFFSANQEVDTESVNKGMLHKIHYPTGGYSEIEYEPNSTARNISKDTIFKYMYSTGFLSNTKEKTLVIDNVESCSYLNLDLCRAFLIEGPETDVMITITNLNLNISNTLSFTFSKFNKNYNVSGPINNFLYIRPCDTIVFDVEVMGEAKFKINAYFSYEARVNRYEKIYGGGVRVKSIIDNDGVSSQNKRTFYYNELSKYPSIESTGNIYNVSNRTKTYVVSTTYPKFISHNPNTGMGQFKDMQLYLINPYPLGYAYDRCPIRYTAITEFFESDFSQKGAIERIYYDFLGKRGGLKNGPFTLQSPPFSNENNMYRGLLKTENFYKEKNSQFILQRKKNYKYEILEKRLFNNYIYSCLNQEVNIVNKLDDKMKYITILSYQNCVEKIKLTELTDITFAPDKNILSKNKFIYGKAPYYNLKNKINFLSNNDSTIINYIYPFDYEQKGIYKLMVDRNMLFPIESVRYKNTIKKENELSRQKNNYQELQSGILPQSIESSSGKELSTVVIFNRYDKRGNILELTKPDNTKNIFLWSYNYQYPVAEILNATYMQVESAVAAIGLGTIDNLSQSVSPDKAKLDALRTKLPDALVTTYTYEPLVGMVSMTDPRGVTTYYEYDSSGRLKNLKDNEKHMVELYQYNYVNKAEEGNEPEGNEPGGNEPGGNEPVKTFSLKFSDIIYNNIGDYGKTLTANIYCKENVTILLTYDFKINSPHSGTNEQVSFSVGTFSEHLLEDSREEGVKIHLSAGNNKVYIEAYKGDRNKGSGSVSISIDKVISENADKWNISSPSSLTFSY